MTRWLQAVKLARGAGTELTKRTEIPPPAEVVGFSSILSILSEGLEPKPAPAAPPPAQTLAPEDEALDAFEERAAIREADGGQAREDAEAAALAEVAQAAGMAPEALQRLWADHPDARAYLAHLTRHGPATVGAAGSALGWGATRAWQAEARLRAAGLVVMGPLGRAAPTLKESEALE